MNISSLAKQAVVVLSLVSEPEYVINAAIKQTSGNIVQPPWKKVMQPENNKFWTIIAKEHDWWLEQNTFFKQYRLVGPPNQKVYVSLMIEGKLESLLNSIIDIGNNQHQMNTISTMSIYQIVVDDLITIKEGCIKLSYLKALELFPNTNNLAAGFYTIHPCNNKALTPIENYLTNLALNKDNECVVLLGKLGAKSVNISRKEGNDCQNNTIAAVNRSGINISVGASILNELKSEMEFKVIFTGNTIDISPDILKRSVWFKNDPQLNALLESLLSKNTPKEWEYSEKSSSTFNFDFKAVANILGIVEAELKNDYKKANQISTRLHVIF